MTDRTAIHSGRHIDPRDNIPWAHGDAAEVERYNIQPADDEPVLPLPIPPDMRWCGGCRSLIPRDYWHRCGNGETHTAPSHDRRH